MKKYIYGIDIGGTTIKIGLFYLNHRLIKKWEIDTKKGNNGEALFASLVESIKKATPNLDEVHGYGLGIPGPVVHNYVKVAVNLGLTDVDLKERLSKELHNDNIFSANDANVAALGEAIYGAGKGEQNVVMVTLGTGVGGGVISDGKIVTGAVGCGGEIGHFIVDHTSDIQCNCGRKGCLETVASATGIRNVYNKLRKTYQGDSPLFKLQYPSAKAIINAAKHGDQLAIQVVDYAAYYLGYTCSILAVTSNPRIIVFGGGVSKAGDYLLDQIRTHFKALTFAPTQNTIIKEATLGNDAGIYGAMQLVVNNG